MATKKRASTASKKRAPKGKSNAKSSNLQKLKEFGVISGVAGMSADQKAAINSLSSAEVRALIAVKQKVPELTAMEFNAAGGIF